jgi:hypothetical protein
MELEQLDWCFCPIERACGCGNEAPVVAVGESLTPWKVKERANA